MYPKYFSLGIIAFQKMHSLRSHLLRRVQHNNNNNNNGALVARGVGKTQFQAGAKVTLNINVVVKKRMLGYGGPLILT